MDDFFQYLIYLFIIISILSSFFKKKGPAKTTTPNPETGPKDTGVKSYPAETPIKSEKSDYDILKEIENMFKIEEPKQTQPVKPSTTNSAPYEMSGDTFSEHIKNSKWHEATASEHQMEKSWHEYTEPATINTTHYTFDETAVSTEIEGINRALEHKIAQENKLLQSIRNRLKEPKTLKEYILISEILGKPKALRR